MATFLGASAAASSTASATAAAGTAAASTATIGYTAASSSLISAGTVANIATGLSVLASVRQGQAAKVNADIQADRIKRDAGNRELNRRKRLIQSLASQNATRAASGISAFEGSSKAAMLEDIRTGAGASLMDRSYAEDAANSVLAAGDYSANTSYINAGATLLDQVDRTKLRG